MTPESLPSIDSSADRRLASRPGDVIEIAPNIISVKHWDRLLGGLLYAVQPRVDWATLLRRSFAVDVFDCPKCHGRLVGPEAHETGPLHCNSPSQTLRL